MSYADEVLADSPEWYFRFEQPSGAFVDSSGFGHTATETGTVTRSLTSPLAEGGLAIATSTTQWLTINYGAPSVLAETIEGWFRTSSTGYVILEQNRGNSPGGVGRCLQLAIGTTGFGAVAGQVTAFVNTTSFWRGKHSTATVNDGAWHHIVATWQGTTGVAVASSQMAIYIDGVAVSTVNDTAAGSTNAPISGSGSMELFHEQNSSRTAQVDADEMAFYTSALSPTRIAAHYAASQSIPPFTADFTADPESGSAPLSVDFLDTSYDGTGTPDTWLWDFGDGSTSTSQNPTHVYTADGSYTVSLTVETDDAETDTETKTLFIAVGDVYVPPSPSNAVIEIYASVPGSARWGVAHWGEDVWASAGWQDVTPQSIDAQVAWGSHSPRDGILTETEASTWLINTYDPERLLDPGNVDGPYYTDLEGGLPVRIRHRGTIVRQGVAERIVYFHKDKMGGMRVTDNLSLMARTPVPSDTDLSDTLRARARDAIASAGLRLTVEPDPPTGDPALAPRLEGGRSVWRHIADAAQQVLHIAYVDRIGTVRFRPWATPYDRARGVDETQLVDLGTEVSSAGLYSVIQVRDEGDVIVEKRLTPTPRYGTVTYLRDELTPDAEEWAQAVLADRALQTVQWIPGDIYPLDANAVEYFATLEALERFSVGHSNTSPIVSVAGIIVGGDIRVISKRGGEAIWSFSFELAQTALQPLYTDTDPPEFLRTEAGDSYLYPG